LNIKKHLDAYKIKYEQLTDKNKERILAIQQALFFAQKTNDKKDDHQDET
jgi:hypothetical protein